MISMESLRYNIIKLIDEQIKEREDLREQMVGSLYPTILTAEIEKLNSLKATLDAHR